MTHEEFKQAWMQALRESMLPCIGVEPASAVLSAIPSRIGHTTGPRWTAKTVSSADQIRAGRDLVSTADQIGTTRACRLGLAGSATQRALSLPGENVASRAPA